jgi:hypothetical protein
VNDAAGVDDSIPAATATAREDADATGAEFARVGTSACLVVVVVVVVVVVFMLMAVHVVVLANGLDSGRRRRVPWRSWTRASRRGWVDTPQCWRGAPPSLPEEGVADGPHMAVWNVST